MFKDELPKRLAKASAAFRRAERTDTEPKDPHFHLHHGDVLRLRIRLDGHERRGLLASARKQYRLALASRPSRLRARDRRLARLALADSTRESSWKKRKAALDKAAERVRKAVEHAESVKPTAAGRRKPRRRRRAR